MTPTADQPAIPTAVRRALSRLILDLRVALEDDYRRQLAAIGIGSGGVGPLPAGRVLGEADQRVRDVAAAVIAREIAAGSTASAAVELLARESAFTFLNRAVGLRCLEERGLLLIESLPETAIRIDPARNASSLYWRVRNALPGTTNPREVWRETLRRAGTAISVDVQVLFDPDDEFAALFPLLPTVQKVVDGLNAPEIPAVTWLADESLGWVYQYYNSAEKDKVYAKLGQGGKLTQPAEIAAATCLYTERYMVDYLLQNTLGALWVELHPDSKLPIGWPYYVRPADGPAGPRADETRRLRDVTLLDPACGSGHFLVRAFDMLVAMYREEGIEAEADVPGLILERNLYGLDIDLRAIQIAALALYAKARALAGPGFRPRRLDLVPADAALPGAEPPAEYLARFRDDPEAADLVRGIWRGLHGVRVFGSLLHPERAVDEAVKRRRERDQKRGPLFARDDAGWEAWKAELLAGLRAEFERAAETTDLGQHLFGKEAAKGVGLVAALGRKYDVVVANPPYAGSRNLSADLKTFLAKEYKAGKRDLYAAFILRCRDFAKVGGRVGMVTMQSWMFLRSFAELRKDVLERTSLQTIAHLGSRAFEEIGGEVVSCALFTAWTAPPASEHRLTGFRLVGPKSAGEKGRLLMHAIAGQAPSVIATPKQADFLPIPETPFVYWLRPRFFELLSSELRLGGLAEVKQGLATGDNERFTRCSWEVSNVGIVRSGRPALGRWFWYAKGGRYQKWAGLEWLVIDWGSDGRSIREFDGAVIRNETSYFREGLTYTPFASGNLGARYTDGGVFDVKGASIFPRSSSISLFGLASIVSSRFASLVLRITAQSGEMHVGYVANLPYPRLSTRWSDAIGRSCIELKRYLVSFDPTERSFAVIESENQDNSLVRGVISRRDWSSPAIQAILHTCEAVNEHLVCESYELGIDDVQEMIDETGTPAGWNTLIVGYDALPEMTGAVISEGNWSNLPPELIRYLAQHERRALAPTELARLKARLAALYCAGTGGKPEETDGDASAENEEPEEAGPILGARIPIPAETFLEELSQKLEVHPISIYWLLKEMREREGLVCPPELKRHLEDYASITLLRLLGYRWPEQDAYEKEHGAILDPKLVDEDGIIPLVPGCDQPTALERIRARLERDFGEAGADESEREFAKWVGRDLGDWLRRDFFKRHVQQFKQRPIAWHFVSPERTFEAFVLYHKLSRATLQKLRAQYAGGFVARLRAEQERARGRKDDAAVRDLQAKIEDVEEFRARLEKIERGDELSYRIRCRWKDETATGRPGPYAPDIDDGVKVNIRPFQEAGLLAMKEVIKKW